ncbi:methyltransferase domain-containing protein [Leptospira congkakensis]|uniref:Arsenite methyltransferase n=1 Tax=Leptospira congkakensis TaxID=2484932 RepID=A0A4Z1AJQ8_9LEPT|nr:methyltransferase domain-containing protein [Leptospira congkakensis]TGL88798.1 methyltransferase domain-containing protein [Leptospira congkakensis]TGL89384.1 methyltransferase domain-containing protein [Leptospira congkakensis]TGL97352.1 methyltransferase domain-containing protein [Leptospira congkakensis]
MATNIELETLEAVQNYYGKVLQTNKDLKTSACCSVESLPSTYAPLLSKIHPTVKEKFYGCGSPFPQALTGRNILDLGCGSGRDVYLLSQLVGESGSVIGIDMTSEQLDVANSYLEYHREQFGYKKSNVSFIKGYIENLKASGIEDNSIDLVVSNCVTNLSPNKKLVFSEIFRVLKPGGELYFSDVFSDQRIPDELKQDPILLGECLGGALYTEDFRRLLSDLGIYDFRVVSQSKINLLNGEIEKKVGNINFYSITFRAFKIPLEDRCEDYGQVAFYKGTIDGIPHNFKLDDHHILVTDKPMLVCGNTADMLSKTHYKDHFRIVGDKSKHFGLFDCGPTPVTSSSEDGAAGACC